ncbi:MAG: DUF1993 family protein [Sphingomonadaceae bacterium]
MTFSLYEATVPTYTQILGAILRLLDKAEAFVANGQASEQELVDARLAPDMLPFAYQVKSTAVHSIGAIEGIRRGEFSPDLSEPPTTFAGLKERVATAIDAIAALTPDEINGFIGRDMCFLFKEKRLEFTGAEAFLISFSMPNFMFHATTAYDLLRMKRLNIGKSDFLVKLPLKKPS